MGSWNGLAGGADAASGPLHPDAERPLSRPPGRSHAAAGPRQGRVASLRDRLRRPLTWPGRRGPASTPPPGAAGARPAGREHPPQGDSAGIGLGFAVRCQVELEPCRGQGQGTLTQGD